MIIDFNNSGGGSGSGSTYVLPIASDSTLGGVKIPSGGSINIDSGGSISLSDAVAMIENGDVKAQGVIWEQDYDRYYLGLGEIPYFMIEHYDSESGEWVTDKDADLASFDWNSFNYTESGEELRRPAMYTNCDEGTMFGNINSENAKFLVVNSNGVFTQDWTYDSELGEWVAGELQPLGGGSDGEGIKIVHHLYEAEYQRVWLDKNNRVVTVESANTIPNGGVLKFYDITKYTGGTVVLGIAGVMEVTTNENNVISVDGTKIPKMYRSAMDVRTTPSEGSFYMDAVRPQFEDGNHLWFTINGDNSDYIDIYLDIDNKEVYYDDDEWQGGEFDFTGSYNEDTDTYHYDLEFNSSSDVNGYTMVIQNYDHIVNEGLTLDGFVFLDAENGFVFVNETGNNRNVTLIDPIRNDIKDGQEVSVYEHFDAEYQFLRVSGQTTPMAYNGGATSKLFEYRNNKLITEDTLIFYGEYYGKYLYAYATINDGYRFEYWNGAKPSGTQLTANTMTSGDTAYTFNFNQVSGTNNSHTFTRVDDGLNFVYANGVATYCQLYPINSPAHSDVVQYTWTDDPELVCDISFNNDFNGTGSGQDGGHFFYIVDYHQFPYGKKLFIHQYYNATDPITFFEVDENEMQINVYTGSTLSAHSETPALIITQGSTGTTGKYNKIIYSWKGNEIKFHNFGGSLDKIYDLNLDLTATGWVRTNIEANVYKGYSVLNDYEVVDSRGDVIAANVMQKRRIRINPTSQNANIGSFFSQSNSDIGPIFAPATTAATADQLCVSAQGWAAPTWKTMLSLLGIKSVWKGTEDEYEAIGAGNYDSNVLYIIVEE